MMEVKALITVAVMLFTGSAPAADRLYLYNDDHDDAQAWEYEGYLGLEPLDEEHRDRLVRRFYWLKYSEAVINKCNYKMLRADAKFVRIGSPYMVETQKLIGDEAFKLLNYNATTMALIHVKSGDCLDTANFAEEQLDREIFERQ